MKKFILLALFACSIGYAALTPINSGSSGSSIATPVSVANGGTGLATLTSNNVILGNGASNVAFAAPGSSGNILTSNGTTWASAAPAGGSLTSTTQSIADGGTITSTSNFNQITASIGAGAALAANASSDGNTDINLANTGNRSGMSFQVTGNGTARSFTFKAKLTTNDLIAGTFTCRIHSDTAGAPGAVLTTSSPIDASILTQTYQVLTCVFPGTALVTATTYYAIVDFTNIQFNTSAVIFDSSHANPYASGKYFESSNSGASWTSYDNLYDLVFTVNTYGTTTSTSTPIGNGSANAQELIVENMSTSQIVIYNGGNTKLLRAKSLMLNQYDIFRGIWDSTNSKWVQTGGSNNN